MGRVVCRTGETKALNPSPDPQIQDHGQPDQRLCRSCLTLAPPGGSDARCGACSSARVVRHPELTSLSLAHIDCDAFYAAVEKRDDPSIRHQPVIVGGGQRGVVTTACYLARIQGVRSAMPMFKARQLCPQAVIIKPDMAKYRETGMAVREHFRALTSDVEPLSIDEAFLDLSSTLKRGRIPALELARLAQNVQDQEGITLSIGLSHNKLLAKIASDLDKPDGFAVLGRSEAADFLRDKPVKLIWGVGPATARRMHDLGISRIGQLRAFPREDMTRLFGRFGDRLYDFCRGEDPRRVREGRASKSVSSETTLAVDTGALAALTRVVERLSYRVADRMERHALAGRRVTLKLKTSDFEVLTRSQTLDGPTADARMLFSVAQRLLTQEVKRQPLQTYRLLGVSVAEFDGGSSSITSRQDSDPESDEEN
ncbi:MAG: DNA polymerase IV [Kiloniella sp.]|nr:DNA polymerase IV [Kiloniella sp.]